MTLAQDYIERGAPRISGNVVVDQMHRDVHRVLLLALQTPLNTDQAQLDSFADRFVFDKSPPDIVQGLVSSGQLTQALVMGTAKHPSLTTWIEYPIGQGFTTIGRLGALIVKNPLPGSEDLSSLIIGVGDVHGTCAAFCAGAMKPLPWAHPAQKSGGVGSYWYLDTPANEMTDEDQNDFVRFVSEIIDAIFLLSTPRVCEHRVATWHPKKQKAREKAGKLPLIEVKHTTIKIGEGPARYAKSHSGTQGEQETKRLHRVAPFFRTYTKRQETPKVAFVPEHWRGDASKGVLLHEKTVKTDAKTKI